MEFTVVSGIVSLKRRRAAMASGRVSAIRAESCARCGYTELYAEKPERLFSDLHREGV
jgi:ribosomal protein L40E